MSRGSPHPVQVAAERFVSVGGRFMLGANGRIVSSIEHKLLNAYRAGFEDRARPYDPFDRAYDAHERARVLQTLVRRRGRPFRGWLVWEKRR